MPCERVWERDGATPTPGPTPIYALPPTGHRQLRIGLLLEGLRQPAWVGRVIDAIQSSRAGEICLVIRFRAQVTAASNNRQPGQSTALLFLSSLYRLVDRVLDSRQGPDPWTLVDASPWLQNVENLEVGALTGESSYRLPAEQAEVIQRRGLDVILAIGGPRWTGDILSAASQGLWRLGAAGGLEGMAEKDQLRDLLGGCPPHRKRASRSGQSTGARSNSLPQSGRGSWALTSTEPTPACRGLDSACAARPALASEGGACRLQRSLAGTCPPRRAPVARPTLRRPFAALPRMVCLSLGRLSAAGSPHCTT